MVKKKANPPAPRLRRARKKKKRKKKTIKETAIQEIVNHYFFSKGLSLKKIKDDAKKKKIKRLIDYGTFLLNPLTLF